MEGNNMLKKEIITKENSDYFALGMLSQPSQDLRKNFYCFLARLGHY